MITLEDMTRQDMINLRDELDKLIGGEEKETIELKFDEDVALSLPLIERKTAFIKLYEGLNISLETNHVKAEQCSEDIYNNKDEIIEMVKGEKKLSISKIFDLLDNITLLMWKYKLAKNPALKLILKE